jgi:hypothetical protein
MPIDQRKRQKKLAKKKNFYAIVVKATLTIFRTPYLWEE